MSWTKPYQLSEKYHELQEFAQEHDADVQLPEHLQQYSLVLDTAHDLYKVFGNRAKGIRYIARLLKLKYPELSQKNALNYVYQAVNFYHAETLLNKDTYKNLKLADLDKALAIAYKQKDMETVRRIIRDQAELKGLFQEDPPELPEELFKPRLVIYTGNIQEMDKEREPTSRKELLEMIEGYNISRQQKKEIKAELDIQDTDYEEIK